MAPPPYLIRLATAADLPRLDAWRRQPHVMRWWGDPALEPPDEVLDEPRVAAWVAVWRDRPFAFIQDYAVADAPGQRRRAPRLRTRRLHFAGRSPGDPLELRPADGALRLGHR